MAKSLLLLLHENTLGDTFCRNLYIVHMNVS